MANFRYVGPDTVRVGGYTFCRGTLTTVSDNDGATLRKLRRHPAFVEVLPALISDMPGSGPAGPKGEPGDTGPSGPKGDKGDNGDTGEPGPAGPAGAIGPQGPAGNMGPQGPTGLAGAQGPKGDTGLTGNTGPQGPMGSTGPAGVQGPPGADSTVPGPQGQQGVKGDTGNTGAQGIQGNPGSQGIQGIQGPPGVDGVRTATTVFGYATGAGGTITQATSRVTAVILNKLAGAITLFSKTTTAGLVETFQVTNSLVLATDTIVASIKSGTGIYFVSVSGVAAGSFKLSVYTPAAVSPAEAPVINFAVVRSVNA